METQDMGKRPSKMGGETIELPTDKDPTEVTAGSALSNLSPEYAKEGKMVFTFIVVLWLICAVAYVLYKLNQRQHPSISVAGLLETHLAFPNTVWVCPDTSDNITYHFYEFFDQESSGIEDGTTMDLQIEWSDVNQQYCAVVDLTAFVSDVPSEIGFAVVFSRTTKGYGDVIIGFDENFDQYVYISAGPYNSSKSVSSTISLSHVLHNSFRAPLSVSSWQFSVVNTPDYYHTYDRTTDISCDSPAQCLSNFTLCEKDLASNIFVPCANQANIWMGIPSESATVYVENDPLEPFAILGTIGGFWVYVGAFFGLFFAVRADTAQIYYPNKFTRRFFSCCCHKKVVVRYRKQMAQLVGKPAQQPKAEEKQNTNASP